MYLHDLPVSQLSQEITQRRAVKLEGDKAGAVIGGILAQAPPDLRDQIAPMFSGANSVAKVEEIRNRVMIPFLEGAVGRGAVKPLDAILVAPESPVLRTAAVGTIMGDGNVGHEVPTALAENWSSSKRTGIEQADLASLLSVPFQEQRQNVMTRVGPEMARVFRPHVTVTSRPDYDQVLPVTEGLAVGLIQSIVPAMKDPQDALSLERARQVRVVASLPQSQEAGVAGGRIEEIDREMAMLKTMHTTSQSEVASYLNKALRVAGLTTHDEWVAFFEKEPGMGGLQNWQTTLLPDDDVLKDPNFDYLDRTSLALTALIGAVDAGGGNASAAIRSQVRDALLALQQPLIEQVRSTAAGISEEQAGMFWKFASNKPGDLALLGGDQEPTNVRLAATLWARSFLTSQAALGAR